MTKCELKLETASLVLKTFFLKLLTVQKRQENLFQKKKTNGPQH